MQDLWEMVRCMIDIPACTSGQSLRLNKNTQKAFIRNARTHLEQSYKKFITRHISGNLQQAQLGGIPGTCNLVRSYLNIRQATLPRGLEVTRLLFVLLTLLYNINVSAGGGVHLL